MTICSQSAEYFSGYWLLKYKIQESVAYVFASMALFQHTRASLSIPTNQPMCTHFNQLNSFFSMKAILAQSHGNDAFQNNYCAPVLWNDPPQPIRCINALDDFKLAIKIHITLFNNSFMDNYTLTV